MSHRVLFYVQHLLGIGHLRRAAVITQAMQAAGLEVWLVSGGLPVAELDLGGARVVQLPPATTADAQFSGIIDEHGRPIDEAWRQRRRALLLEAFDRIAPAVVLLELFPFGRRQFRFELIPLLETVAALRPRPPVAVSVRDILVSAKPERVREAVEVVRRFVDRVLVHGDPRLVPFDASFPAASEIADRLQYTGYVVDAAASAQVEPIRTSADTNAREEMSASVEDPVDTARRIPLDNVKDHAPAAHPVRRGEVLVSTGGGSVGLLLLRTALEARPLTRCAAQPWRLITGPNLPESAFTALCAAAGPGVTVERFRADFADLLRRCSLSLSQAGYNTVMEILVARKPAVVVPFAEGRESEQEMRARLLARRGFLHLVEATDLEPRRLAATIEEAAGRLPPPFVFDVDGAHRTAEIVASLAERAAVQDRSTAAGTQTR